jgi:hypothetical protein
MKLDGSIPEVPTKKWPNNKQIRTASEIYNWLSVYTKRNFLNELFLKIPFNQTKSGGLLS